MQRANEKVWCAWCCTFLWYFCTLRLLWWVVAVVDVWPDAGSFVLKVPFVWVLNWFGRDLHCLAIDSFSIPTPTTSRRDFFSIHLLSSFAVFICLLLNSLCGFSRRDRQTLVWNSPSSLCGPPEPEQRTFSRKIILGGFASLRLDIKVPLFVTRRTEGWGSLLHMYI